LDLADQYAIHIDPQLFLRLPKLDRSLKRPGSDIER
jgi:hypothetical protein